MRSGLTGPQEPDALAVQGSVAATEVRISLTMWTKNWGPFRANEAPGFQLARARDGTTLTAYVADWSTHAGGPPTLAPAPFPLRIQTSADLDATRWGLLAWEDPRRAMPASPFWFDEAMPEGRFVELDNADAPPILARLGDAGATTVVPCQHVVPEYPQG